MKHDTVVFRTTTQQNRTTSAVELEPGPVWFWLRPTFLSPVASPPNINVWTEPDPGLFNNSEIKQKHQSHGARSKGSFTLNPENNGNKTSSTHEHERIYLTPCGSERIQNKFKLVFKTIIEITCGEIIPRWNQNGSNKSLKLN